MLKTKFDRILMAKLPANIKTELEEIDNDTNHFQDEEIVEIYKDNFNDLFAIIETKYPDAIKPKAKLKKPVKVKLKKNKVEKPAEKKKLKKVGGSSYSKNISDYEIYKSGPDEFDVKYNGKVITDLIGNGSNWGEKEDVVADLKKFIERDFSPYYVKADKTETPAKDTPAKDLDCEDAKEIIADQQKKRLIIKKKREEAPKKKSSTIIIEKTARAFSSVLKLKDFKEDKTKAIKMAAALKNVFKDHDMLIIATGIKAKTDEIIAKHFKKDLPKAAKGAIIKDGIFIGTPNATHKTASDLFNKSKSYVLKNIAPEKWQILYTAQTPNEAIAKREELIKENDSDSNKIKLHYSFNDVENPQITITKDYGRNYAVDYVFEDGDQTFEISGTLEPDNSGREDSYRFEPAWYADDESEAYWDINWEEIEEEILKKHGTF